jgi:hypothetical protein
VLGDFSQYTEFAGRRFELLVKSWGFSIKLGRIFWGWDGGGAIGFGEVVPDRLEVRYTKE